MLEGNRLLQEIIREQRQRIENGRFVIKVSLLVILALILLSIELLIDNHELKTRLDVIENTCKVKE